MKRDLAKDDEKLITRLWTILDGKDAPETRIGQALVLLARESETEEMPGRSFEASGSSLRLEQADDLPKSSSFARKKKPAPVLIGNSTAMQTVYTAIQRVSNSSATVLIRGESGTGKELAAQSIHLSSARADQPFVAVHCAAVPETLIETTLFGHERGAFTERTRPEKDDWNTPMEGRCFLMRSGIFHCQHRSSSFAYCKTKNSSESGVGRRSPWTSG